jgi:hypothetical protein
MITNVILIIAFHIILYILIFKFYEKLFFSKELQEKKKAEKRKIKFYNKTVVKNEDFLYPTSSN